MFRYKLPYDSENKSKTKEVINGFLVYTYRWIYSKTKLDLPGTIEEEATSLKKFVAGDTEERLRASHFEEVKEEQEVQQIEEIIEEKKEMQLDYTKLKKPKLIELLSSKGFLEKEYKNKTKKELIKLLILSDEVEISE